MMRQEYTAEKYREILGRDLEQSDLMEERIQGAYDIIRVKKKIKKGAGRRQNVKGLIMGVSAVAAAFVLSVTAFVANPALAAKFSFIDKIFGIVETEVGYPGDYSKDAVQLVSQADVGEDGTVDSPYVQTDGDITFTISECNYESMAMYLAVSVKSENGFSEEFRNYARTGTYEEVKEEELASSHSTLYMTSTSRADFSSAGYGVYEGDPEHGTSSPYYINGKFVDDYTFAGIIRVDLMSMSMARENDPIPDEFPYHLCVTDLFADFEGEHLTGKWEFDLDVKLNHANTITKEIQKTNEEGIGIGKVIRTSYELNAELLLPDGKSRADYIVAVCDAEGKLLESQGENTEICSVYGRDVSKVFVYVVDYMTYMDECKGNNAHRLPEKAVFQTEVVFE